MTKEYLIMSNWEERQTYRKDRGTPPWIKVYRNLMTNPKWCLLSDKEKGQLVSLWIIAADDNGRVPENPTLLQKIALLDDVPNINKFKELGLMTSSGCQVVAKLASTGCQLDAPETETETETETESISASQNPPVSKYKFEGETVKLSQKDFDKFKAQCSLLTEEEFVNQLLTADEYYTHNFPDKWFFKIGKWLREADVKKKKESKPWGLRSQI